MGLGLGEGGGRRARLLGFIWQTRNDGQNWIRKPNSLFRCTREKKQRMKKKGKKMRPDRGTPPKKAP